MPCTSHRVHLQLALRASQDFFSVGVPLFSSRYTTNENGEYVPTWDIKNEGNGLGGPYPFGVDWAWHGASNELMFMNSLKMKLSVLFGVLQMTLGVFLRFGNSIFFKNKVGASFSRGASMHECAHSAWWYLPKHMIKFVIIVTTIKQHIDLKVNLWSGTSLRDFVVYRQKS